MTSTRSPGMSEPSRAEALFFAALEQTTPALRAAYLDNACAGNAALRSRVEALLAGHAEAGQFLEHPVAEAEGVAALATEEPGETSPSLDFLAPPSEPGSLGRLDHYEILEVVGQGGMGVVLRARDTKLQRVVAIKALAVSLAASAASRHRFAREARAAAAVRDDHVVAIHAVCDEAPVPFLVMEFIDGQNLEDVIRSDEPLDVKDILRIGSQIASGLAAAHQQGLIHRDIKPANILLENGVQRVKLTDFGLARAADDASLTHCGLIAGTPLYMAPEQAANAAVDFRADLFSLGSVLYELCTSRPAFRAPTTIAVIRRVCDETPRPIHESRADIPEPLCRVIDRLHAKEPADRPGSAREVADLLTDLLAELNQGGSRLTDRTRVVQGAARLPESTRREWLWIAAAAVLLLAGLGASEATGVTDVQGTVIRLFSPEGTLVVEVDDPDVSVAVDGADMVITGAGAKEIRLKPGQYKVEASKDGKVFRQELVTVTRNGRQVVRVSKESASLNAISEWEKSVAAMPAEEQVLAVERRLRELNPEFRGKFDSQIREGKVYRVIFLSDRVTDISPVRALPELKSLDCGGSSPQQGRLSDLTPLRGMRLIRLQCGYSQVSDLEPLRDMPLEYLHCENTIVRTLSPLEGMKLVHLTIQNTSVSDLRPLRGMPLRALDFYEARRVSDLLPLTGMPLEYLNVTGANVNNLMPLSSLKSLTFLILDRTRITDLTPLRNLRLERISFVDTAVTDLTPLEGMPLKLLRFDYRPDRELFVRSFPGLEFINEKPAAVFWKEVEGK